MEIVQMLCPSSKYGIKAPYGMTPQGITLHNTANDASAKNEISYMITNNNKVSYHYAVDDVRAVQGIPLDRNAWHAGDGGSGFGNRYTIGIEICYSKSGGDRFHQAERNAAELTARLMLQYGWGIDRVNTKTVNTHQSRSGKYCPHRTLDEGIGRLWTMIREEYSKLSGQPVPTPTPTPTPAPSGDSYLVQVTTGALNIRNGAGTSYEVTGCIRDKGCYTIVETSGNWGRLKSGAGWICLDYTKRIDGGNTPAPTPTPQPSGRNVGDVVTINGVYSTSMSDKKLTPAVKSGTITKIVNGANNPYLLNNGNIGWVNESCIVGGSTPAPTPSTSGRSVGEVVSINGVYTSSSSTNKLVPAVKSGTITHIESGARNPYLLNNGNIGWVNDSCIVGGSSSTPSTGSFSKGQRVTIKSSASTYCTGQKIPSSVKGKTYTIMQVGSGSTHPDGVLLKEIMSWVYKKDVQ